MVTISVRVTPRADRNRLVGVRSNGVLVVRTTAAPVDGAANQAVMELIATALGIRRSQISLVAGQKARDKRLEIEGLTPEGCEARLSALPRIE